MINLKINKNIFNKVYYKYLFDYSHRYEVYYGGSGSGKSVFVFQKMLIKALNEKRKTLVIRKVMATQKDSCWQLMIDILSNFKIYGECEINKSTFTITLPNGSVFLFKGLDDSEKIKSIAGITDIVCEEATELTLDDVSQLDLRLRTNADNLQMIFMFNPCSKSNWVYKRWFSDDSVVNNDTIIIKTTYKDNKFLPDSYIKNLENMINTNPTYYRIYALGEFCSLDKLVFTNWKVQDFDSMELAKLGYEHRCGSDLGWIDKTTIIETLYDRKNKTIYVCDEFYKSGVQLSEVVDAIKKMRLEKTRIFFDSAEPRSIDYFKKQGVYAKPCIKGKDSVKAGIMFLQDHTIIINPKCENLITEFENFSYIKSKQTGEYTEETTHEWSHAIDGLRYAYSDIYTKGKLKTLNKNAL